MNKLFHTLAQVLCLILLVVFITPLVHGLEELFHDHEGDHCHIAQHECSDDALRSACHLSVFHGDTQACEDHHHFSVEEKACELCLFAQLRTEYDTQGGECISLYENTVISWEAVYLQFILQRSATDRFLRGPPTDCT